MLDAASQKIRPKELAERRRILCKAAHATELTGERAIGIVPEIADGFWDVPVRPALAFLVERMHPAAIVEDEPERVDVEPAQILERRDEHAFDALFMQRTRKVMVIDDVVAALGSQD